MQLLRLRGISKPVIVSNRDVNASGQCSDAFYVYSAFILWLTIVESSHYSNEEKLILRMNKINFPRYRFKDSGISGEQAAP